MVARLSADVLARYIIQKCINDERPISNLQLQKILYFCQRRTLQATGRVLFDDEIQAWQYGPVVPNVYRTFSLWGGRKINWLHTPFDVSLMPDSIKGLVDPVIESKRELEPWQLVSETHVPGSAWHKIYNGGAGDGGLISVDMIRTDPVL